MSRIDCSIIRGGTSKGIYLDGAQLPAAGPERDRAILEVFGSPDARQIDGLGGADKLTSKVAVMGAPTRSDCAIDYLFGQVGIELPRIDWTSNCGNLSAGAALYAALRLPRPPDSGMAEVAIHQANTGCRLVALVPFQGGRPLEEGDFAIGGVPGTAARIDLDYSDFAGAILKRGLLPTGRPVDSIVVHGLGTLEVSIVDAANLCLFVRAADVGLDPRASVIELQRDGALVARLEAIRAASARALGFLEGPGVEEELKTRVNPLLFAVAAPQDYAIPGGRVAGSDHDLLSRSIARGAFSKAYPATGSIATAAAAGMAGTIPAAFATPADPAAYELRIGHPGGTLAVAAGIEASGTEPRLRRAVVGRTARLLMQGQVPLRNRAA